MNKNINCKLKKYRKINKMTQKDLGKRVGVSGDYISQLERGRTPGMVTALKLAQVFDTTLEELFFSNILTEDKEDNETNKNAE